jgi:DNA-binding GntR family transcriptional regulator
MPTRPPELPSARVEADLRRRLAEDEWAPGEALPTVTALAREYSVGKGTVNKVLRTLADDGLVTVIRSWGTFRTDREASG